MAVKQFNDVPVIRRSRSRFDLSHGVKTAGNVGTLYPFDVQEVYPGDTFKVKTNTVTRLTSSFLKPVMDNLFLDVYYFFVPSRILYDKFVNVFGENTESAYANTQEYQVPMADTSQEVVVGTVADYMGLPVGTLQRQVSILPFRAFAKIYDDWFRDQNVVNPMHIQNGDFNSSELFNDSAWGPANYTGKPPKVAKFHDYFTSCLPSPQKGAPVDLPLVVGNDVPVIPVAEKVISTAPAAALQFSRMDNNTSPTSGTNGTLLYAYGPSGRATFSSNNVAESVANNIGLYPNNLRAMTSELDFNSVSVNDLRYAFQLQKLLERDSYSGSRYVEFLASHFSVQAGDYRLQRSEYLGGKRVPLTITQVIQSTGANSDSSPLGEVGAYSLSNSRSRFTKSFVEHGYVIGCFCIRQHHTYQQGIERFWTRSKRTDFYDPVFSHIGEQPVYTTELYGNASGVSPDTVFGYNEAWADLRYRPNHITGQMRSNATESLNVWHFGDYYSSVPTLSQGFIEETPIYVDRAITVESSSQSQFILDFWVQNIAYRCLPTYSVPSLIDHD